ELLEELRRSDVLGKRRLVSHGASCATGFARPAIACEPSGSKRRMNGPLPISATRGRSPAMAEAPLTRRAGPGPGQLAHLPLGGRVLADGTLPTRVGITGTGDDLLVLTWSPAGLAREVAAGARVLRRLGIGPAMRVANTLPGALAT